MRENLAQETQWGGIDQPQFKAVDLHINPESLRECLPAYDERRAILARDPLASVDGFRVLAELTIEILFGVRFCRNCPRCSESVSPCTDLCGSNASPEGGVFGRADAFVGA